MRKNDARPLAICTLVLATGCGVGDLEVYAIEVTREGMGTGSVRSMPGEGIGPAQIDCPPNCKVLYGAGLEVVLVATPVPGSTFDGWAGDCTGAGECRLTSDKDHAVTARFGRAAIPSHEVMVERVGVGLGTVTSTPAGIDCGMDCAEVWPTGTRVALVATPITGAVFSGWSGACSGNAECRLTVNGPARAVASFARRPYSVQVVPLGTGTGTVTSVPGGIRCVAPPNRCTTAFDFGTMVSLTAVPGPRSTFTGWGGDCRGNGVCAFVVDGAKRVEASFETETRQLSVVRQGAGPGSVRSNDGRIACGTQCSFAYVRGTQVVLTATPDQGATFVGWSGDCSGRAACTLTMDRDRSVIANFMPVFPTLRVVLAGMGSGSVTSDPTGIDCRPPSPPDPPPQCIATYPFGTQVTLTSTPGATSRFVSWSGLGCSGSVRTCSPTLTMDGTITATFEPR